MKNDEDVGFTVFQMSVSENNNRNTGNFSAEPDLMNFLVSSIHDTKNSVCLLLNSLDKALANADARKLAAQLALELDHSLPNQDERPLSSEESLEVAHLLLVAGDKEKAIRLLQSEIKNNPENPALHKDVSNIFEQAGMQEEGSQLIEATRQEAMLVMNRGVLLVSKGQYEEALCAMREARAAMPSNVRVLLNLAHVIIVYIQKNGAAPELVEEARNSLMAANELSPGEPRFKRLLTSLNELV